MAVWYQMELIAKERHERVQREAAEARMHRLAGGNPHSPAKPSRVRFLSRR